VLEEGCFHCIDNGVAFCAGKHDDRARLDDWQPRNVLGCGAVNGLENANLQGGGRQQRGWLVAPADRMDGGGGAYTHLEAAGHLVLDDESQNGLTDASGR
jgi:hypothetical protein